MSKPGWHIQIDIFLDEDEDDGAIMDLMDHVARLAQDEAKYQGLAQEDMDCVAAAMSKCDEPTHMEECLTCAALT